MPASCGLWRTPIGCDGSGPSPSPPVGPRSVLGSQRVGAAIAMGTRDDEYDYLFKGTARPGRPAPLSGSAAPVGPVRFGPALPVRSPAARALRCEGAALPARPRPAGFPWALMGWDGAARHGAAGGVEGCCGCYGFYGCCDCSGFALVAVVAVCFMDVLACWSLSLEAEAEHRPAFCVCAFQQGCKLGNISCVEPGWLRAEAVAPPGPRVGLFESLPAAFLPVD